MLSAAPGIGNVTFPRTTTFDLTQTATRRRAHTTLCGTHSNRGIIGGSTVRTVELDLCLFSSTATPSPP